MNELTENLIMMQTAFANAGAFEKVVGIALLTAWLWIPGLVLVYYLLCERSQR